MVEPKNKGLAEKLQIAISDHRQGKLEIAEIAYRDILSAEPDHAEALHMMGIVYFQRKKFHEAEGEVQKALAANPDQAKFYNTLGSILTEQARFKEALQAFEDTLFRDPSMTMAIYNKGTMLLKIGKNGHAEKAFREALAAGARDANLYNNLANALVKQGRIGDAVKCCRDGLVANANNVLLGTTLASALEQSNDLEAAETAILEVRGNEPEYALARIILARVLRRRNALDDALACLVPLLETSLSAEDEAEANYEMGLIQDSRQQFSDAYQHFQVCNTLQSKSPNSEGCNGERYLDEIIEYRKLAEKPLGKISGEIEDAAPIFFVGFPRSGTTLMEQMLKAHPKIVTTDEVSPLAPVKIYAHKWAEEIGKRYPNCLDDLTSLEAAEMRQIFWLKAEELVGPLNGRVLVDKLPLNIVSLALVEKLWPKAKILVALRDPRDVCLSCFIQRFSLNDAMVNFLDIEKTGSMYEEVMGLWLQYKGMLEIAWHEYKYEDLVDDFEGTLRSILEFLGVPWDESVAKYREGAMQRVVLTPSYREVTSPIHKKAVQRWRGYQDELSPILPALEFFVQKFGYDD